MIINQFDISAMEQRYRATFINSLAGVKQVVLVGTRSVDGQSNLAIFNSLIHIGANPALYGIVFRPDTVRRDTLRNILETGQYTLNYVQSADFEKAHQTSAKYETNLSEFSAIGFKEQYYESFTAPFVKEAVVKIGMKFEEKTDLKINGTMLVIGSIQHIEINENIVGKDGFISLADENVLACSGLDAYYTVNFLGRLSYAKPEKWPEKLQ
ncbi:MAG: flavin reductase family protein [Bacteroidales bacterium]|nr:flavin reductase family protein [Bacteroidales bacterium]